MQQKGYQPMHLSPQGISSVRKVKSFRLTTEVTMHLTPFDQKEYRQLIEARGKTLQHTVRRLKPAVGLSNAVDAGCGAGVFSHTLADFGLDVFGIDARGENGAG